ncbi:kynureninase/PvdN C-terminal domain-containing protein [Micromonospora psammae]|uniref:kynureninase/PvdN C-terminal domain-containing protein n=1 Tax=Micromonospora sp. CPCC 205556 TaxID=3122398 RepID=UPI002FF18D7C
MVGDHRVPDRLRLGPAALYTRFVDVWDAMDRLRDIAARRSYERMSGDASRVT